MINELSDRDVIVRKSHKCVWCGESIARGEKAHYRVYIFDGFTADYYHPECYKAMCTYPGIGWDDGFEEFMFKRGSHEEK